MLVAGRGWPKRWLRGQSLVEFSPLAPVLFMMLFLMIDFGRLVYTYGAIAWATREGARLASLEPQANTDCPILQRVEQVGRGFPITPDPNSLANNSKSQPTCAAARTNHTSFWPGLRLHLAGGRNTNPAG